METYRAWIVWVCFFDRERDGREKVICEKNTDLQRCMDSEGDSGMLMSDFLKVFHFIICCSMWVIPVR